MPDRLPEPRRPTLLGDRCPLCGHGYASHEPVGSAGFGRCLAARCTCKGWFEGEDDD